MEEIDIEICLKKINKNCKNIYIYKKKTTVKQRNYHYKKFIFYF